jgi:hypothetical protein
MTIALNWNMVASVSSAAASIVALVALFATIIIYMKQRDEEHAAQIREDIRSFTGATTRLVQLLEDGSPLISASWCVIETVHSPLSQNPSVDEVRELLNQKGVGLAIAVASWDKSPEAEGLRSVLAEHLTASKRLGGDLNILSEAGDMLQSIAQDMNMTFIRLLNEPQLMRMFLKDTAHVTDVSLFLAALATNLHGNTAMYFATRYLEAIRSLNELISTVAAATTNLEARNLITVARAKSPLSEEESRTATMRRTQVSLRHYIRPDISTKISTLIDKVEYNTSKEAASEKLHQAKLAV